MRLNRFIAHAGICSRREADLLIEQGKVMVNGKKVLDFSIRIKDTDQVCVDGKEIQLEIEKIIYMVNKPVGYVSTVSDPYAKRTVLDLVATSYRIYPVGRLDKDSEGLILLTNDGDLANRLTHPSFQVPKTYRVWVSPALTIEGMNLFKNGIVIDGSKTAPAQIKMVKQNLSSALYEVELKEGRNRQIRKMMAKLGSKVTGLKRIALGPIQLGKLDTGAHRLLTKDELSSLEKLSKEPQ